MKNLSLRQLQVLDAVAEAASYSAAAERLGITQPAVSMQMRQLEAGAGVPLVARQGRQLALTAAGATLLRHARAILEQTRLADEALENLARGRTSHLHLGVVSTANYFAPTLLMGFQRSVPGVSFKLSVARREEILAMLGDHRIDVAIAGHPPGEAEVEAETFARHPHVIVAAARHRLAGQRRIPWRELRDEPFIFREAGSATRQFLEHLLQSNALEPTVSAELAGNETVKQAVMAGMGISLLSAHAVQVELQAKRLAVLDVVDMPRWLDWCLLHRRDSQLGGLGAAFREHVLAQGRRAAACRL